MSHLINIPQQVQPGESLCVADKCLANAVEYSSRTVPLCHSHLEAAADAWLKWNSPPAATPRPKPQPSPVAILKRNDHRCPKCKQYLCRQREMDLFFCRNRQCNQPDLSRVEMAQLVARRKKAAEELISLTAKLTKSSQAAASRSLVYYLGFGDRVKIGTTTNLPKRLKAIPHDEVLAIEPGGYDREAFRHAQFASIRITGEWFRRTRMLEHHINAINERFGAA